MNLKGIFAVLVVALSFVVVGCSDQSSYIPKNKTDRTDRVVDFFVEDDDFDIDLYKKPKKVYYVKERKFQQEPKKPSYYKRKKKTKTFFSSRKRRY